jgi:hypothetical protein
LKGQSATSTKLENPEARVAILVGEGLRNAGDLLDQQPAAVLEAILDRIKLLQLPGYAPKHRYKLRAAIIEYLEERLHEAQAREHRLAHAITGAENLLDD